MPPIYRRAIVLIDPSYEVKIEYAQAIDAIEKSYKKFPTGTYILWYPNHLKEKVAMMKKRLERTAIKNIQCFELGIDNDPYDQSMQSSGVLIINPPWTLMKTMNSCLPELTKRLGQSPKAYFKAEVFKPE